MSVTDTTHTAESGHDSNGNSDHRRREARRAMGGGLVAILATLVLLVLVAGAVLVPRALVRGGNSPETSTPEALPAPEPGAPQATTVPDTAPGATATTVVASAEPCSAEVMGRPQPQTELSASVAARRQAILDAALTCDYAALRDQLADDFVASLGGGDPIELWRAQEANGQQPMATLVALLAMPHRTITFDDGPESPLGEQRVEVWPSAATYGVWAETPDSDRTAVAGVHTPEELDTFEQLGYYAGYRLGIDENGDWTYFLAGD